MAKQKRELKVICENPEAIPKIRKKLTRLLLELMPPKVELVTEQITVNSTTKGK